jgi:Asp-tRNA(Asn)/Glu-tRNA(Gln) amidotransferase A subunit family amidase
MARYVEDLALALRVISGLDARDPYTFDLVPPRRYQQIRLEELTIAVWDDDGQQKAAAGVHVQPGVKD